MINIKSWMSKPVVCGKLDDSIFSAVKKMAKHNIGCLVIVDKGKKIQGILTERDLLRKVIAKNKNLKSLKVEDIMTKNVKTVSVNSQVLEIMKLMEKGKFRDTPITENGNVIGIITSQDIIRMLSV